MLISRLLVSVLRKRVKQEESMEILKTNYLARTQPAMAQGYRSLYVDGIFNLTFNELVILDIVSRERAVTATWSRNRRVCPSEDRARPNRCLYAALVGV